MRRSTLILAVVGFLGAGVVWVPAIALRLVPTAQASAFPNAQGGKVTLAAATATLIPTTSLNGRTDLAIYNLGTATVYCGYTSSVATTTGFPIPPNGSLSLGVSYRTSQAAVVVYCIATDAQTAPNDLRWIEIL